MRRHALLPVILLVASCAKREAPVPAPPAAPTSTPAITVAVPTVPVTAPTAAPTAPAGPSTPRPAVAAPQQELSALVRSYVLTEETLDRILLCERDLTSFWAVPENSRSIRGQLSLGAIYAAIERTPRVKKTLEAFHLAPADYVLGTFAMFGGYAYETVRRKDPSRVIGKAPPVTWPTLEVIQRRYDDVQMLVLPRPSPTPAAP